MACLVLELRKGDILLINGAIIRFTHGVRLELPVRARFLFGKQVMAPDQATTPARRIYHALQQAYVGPDDQRADALKTARALIAAYEEKATEDARDRIERIRTLLRAEAWHPALKEVRLLMATEIDAMEHLPLPGGVVAAPQALPAKAW